MVLLGSMRTFNTYQQPEAPSSLARKWFFRALIASIIIHAVLFAILRSTTVKTFPSYTTERLVPRNFNLGRVNVDAQSFADNTQPKKEEQQQTTAANPNKPPAQNIEVPKDTPVLDASNPPDVVLTPTGPDSVKGAVPIDSPKTPDTDLKNLTKMQQNVSKQLDNDLNKISDELINEKSPTSAKSVLKFSDNTKGSASGNPTGNDSAIPGTKSLDEALTNSGGGLQSGDEIGLRGGALFEFDSSDLLPIALNQLKDLANTLKDVSVHHPKASFTIKGYADSIGAQTDPQYNKDLSQRRADAVKNFFQTAGVDQSRLQAIGYGSTEFIDPPTYDPAKQALEPDNRRVIIVITFPR